MNYLFVNFHWLWNCLSWFSITFKVPQVSVLFNFQGPACSPLGQLIYYIKGHTLCQALFWYFLSFPSAFQKLSTRSLSGSPLRFCWCIALIQLSLSRCLTRQLVYNTTLSENVNTFFSIFFIFFRVYFWAGCIWCFSLFSSTTSAFLKSICFLPVYIIV